MRNQGKNKTLERKVLLAGGAVGSLEVDGEGAEAPVGGEAEGGARVEYLMKEGDYEDKTAKTGMGNSNSFLP